MENAKEIINVIITTLSIQNGTGINLYKCDEKFFFARQQQIPGTLYFMSRIKTDYIFVIGSEKTKNDDFNYPIKSHDDGRNCDISDSTKELKDSINLFDIDFNNEKFKKANKSYNLYLQELYDQLTNPNYDYLKVEWKENKMKSTSKEDEIDKTIKNIENGGYIEIIDTNKKLNFEIQFIAQELSWIKKTIDEFVKKYSEKEIHFFLDVQGGYRTQSSILNNILQATRLFNNNVFIDQIISTDFDPSRLDENLIKDETSNVLSSELIDAIKVFKRSCRAEDINDYFKYVNNDKKPKLIKVLTTLSESILLGNVDDTLNILQEFKTDSTNYIQDIEKNNDVEKIDKEILCSFTNDLIEEIENSGIFNGNQEIDLLKYVEWCYNKSLIQQALTIIESKMPEYIEKIAGIEYTLPRDGNVIDDYCVEFLEISKLPYISDSSYLMNNVVSGNILKKIKNIKDKDESNVIINLNEEKETILRDIDGEINGITRWNSYTFYRFKMLKELYDAYNQTDANRTTEMKKRKKNNILYNIIYNNRNIPTIEAYNLKNKNSSDTSLEDQLKAFIDDRVFSDDSIMTNSSGNEYTENGISYKYVTTDNYNKIINAIIDINANTNNKKKLEVLKTFCDINEIKTSESKKYKERELSVNRRVEMMEGLISLINGFELEDNIEINYYSSFLTVWKILNILHTNFKITIGIQDDLEKMNKLDNAFVLMDSIKGERNSVNHAASMNMNSHEQNNANIYRQNYANIKEMISLFIDACETIKGGDKC